VIDSSSSSDDVVAPLLLPLAAAGPLPPLPLLLLPLPLALLLLLGRGGLRRCSDISVSSRPATKHKTPVKHKHILSKYSNIKHMCRQGSVRMIVQTKCMHMSVSSRPEQAHVQTGISKYRDTAATQLYQRQQRFLRIVWDFLHLLAWHHHPGPC
jgi:hypothetical protein